MNLYKLGHVWFSLKIVRCMFKQKSNFPLSITIYYAYCLYLLFRVDGLHAIVITDREGVPVLKGKCNISLFGLHICASDMLKFKRHTITNPTRQSEMADLARRATRDLSQFHMGGPNFDTGRSWKL